MRVRSLITSLLVFASVGCVASTARADDWPDRPIRMVVPSAAGSGADVMARLLTEQLGKQMGVSFIVDDKPGGAQIMGTMDVVRAKPDGYTIGYGNLIALATNRALLDNVPYDVDRDLTLLGGTWRTYNFLVVDKASPYKNVADLVAAVRAQPGKLSYGTDGVGTSAHLGMKLFEHLTGTKMVHVPYKGATAALTDLFGGRIDVMLVNSSVVAGYVKSGQVRALGVSTVKRDPDFAQVPTIGETVPGYEITAWAGMFAPAKLPPAIAQRLESEIQKALVAPGMAEKCRALGVELTPNSGEQFRTLVHGETVRWADVVKTTGAKNE
jgi:tripartite-type tricarboxylate transporter receptor subunit TctC